MMMNVLTIRPVVTINALIHVEFSSLVGKEHYVRQLYIDPCVAVLQPGVETHSKNASNMSVVLMMIALMTKLVITMSVQTLVFFVLPRFFVVKEQSVNHKHTKPYVSVP